MSWVVYGSCSRSPSSSVYLNNSGTMYFPMYYVWCHLRSSSRGCPSCSYTGKNATRKSSRLPSVASRSFYGYYGCPWYLVFLVAVGVRPSSRLYYLGRYWPGWR